MMTTKEYNEIVDTWADRIFRFVLSNIRDEDIARDIVQDTFEKFWIKRNNVDKAKAKTYLFTTANNTLIDHTRKVKRLSFSDQPKEQGYESGYSDLNEILHEAVSKLPEIQRSVILLRDYEGYSYQEIADMNDLSLEQVKVYIFRGRKFLKNYIGSIEQVI